MITNSCHTRLTAAIALRDQVETALARLGLLRFACFLIGAGAVWSAAVFGTANLVWLLAPLAAFIALSLRSEWLSRRLLRENRIIGYLTRKLDRLEDRWRGRGIAGSEFQPHDHPYAADLDLFGKGSLFERLCDCPTQNGRATLASWLLAPAETETIRARQASVAELASNDIWLESFQMLAGEMRRPIQTHSLAAWGTTGLVPNPIHRLLVLACNALAIIAVVGWVSRWWSEWVPATTLIAQAVLTLMLLPRTRAATAGIDRHAAELSQLSGLLRLIESSAFATPLLAGWRAELITDGCRPSEQLRRLGKLIDRRDLMRQFVFVPIGLFLLWNTHVGLSLEKWRRSAGASLGNWFRILGEWEALNAIAGYRQENPADVFPEFIVGDAELSAKRLGHPLLPATTCIRNDVALGGDRRLLIVSGSNMSGKSTYLRSVGVSAVLAQMGAPVRAEAFRMTPLAIGASLSMRDSLLEGKSRFYAEILRIRAVVELKQGPRPVLFLLDELLHGTNSHDRRIGAEAIVRGLLKHGAIGMITTHDLSLAEMAGTADGGIANVHFADDVLDGEMHFDYILRDGPVSRSNALELLRSAGLIE